MTAILVLSGTSSAPAPRRCLEGADVTGDPVGEPLGPSRLRVFETRCTEDGDEDLSVAPLPGDPIDDHRNTVARIVHEQLVPGRMDLAHRYRQAAFSGTVELTEPAITEAVGLGCDRFPPQDPQRHMLALEVAMYRRPVGLNAGPATRFWSRRRKQPLLQNLIGGLALVSQEVVHLV